MGLVAVIYVSSCTATAGGHTSSLIANAVLAPEIRSVAHLLLISTTRIILVAGTAEGGRSVSRNIIDHLSLKVGNKATPKTGRADGELVITTCGAVITAEGDWRWRLLRERVCSSETEGIREMRACRVDC